MNQSSPYLFNNEGSSPSYRQGIDMSYQSQEIQSTPGDEVKFLKKKYKKSQNKVFHDFYKTKNICTKGESCPFAHSDDELREKPNLAKTKLCETFLESGYCKNGDQCSFAHGEGELRSTPDLFKTAICNLWNQGKCTSGDRCRFAHGVEDLRPAPMHYKPKKTQYNQSPNNNSYRPIQPKMPILQPPTIYSYPTQFTPMINTPTFPTYSFTPTYQEVQPRYFQVPFTFTGTMGMSKGPIMGKPMM